jgi:hypothetical protein
MRAVAAPWADAVPLPTQGSPTAVLAHMLEVLER